MTNLEEPSVRIPPELPEKDKKLLKEIEFVFNEARSYRKKFDSRWKKYERFYDGEQWENNFGDDQKPVDNWIFTILESEVPVLTDTLPGTDIVAIEEENLEKARVLKEAINFVYSFNHLDIRIAQAIRTALKIGTGFLYVDFDGDLEGGSGQVVIKNMPWRYVYLDPSSGDIDDMSYVVLRIPMKVANLKRLYPEHAKGIKAEDVEIDDGVTSTIFEDPTRFNPPTGTSPGRGFFRPVDMAYLFEVWRRDYTLETIPEEETAIEIENEYQALANGGRADVTKWMDHEDFIAAHEGSLVRFSSDFLSFEKEELDLDEAVLTIPEIADFQTRLEEAVEQHEQFLEEMADSELVKRPKYPGNLRLTLKTGFQILYDGPAPVEDGKIPIVPIYAYKEEDQPYGFGEVKNILSAQIEYNDMNYAEYQALRLVSNPGWIKDDNSNVNADTLTNAVGIVITKKAGTEVRRLEPGQVSPQLSLKQQDKRGIIESISGINEATQGRKPRGVTAARAIEFLQQQAVGRIRLKTRMLEEFSIGRLGNLTVSRIIKYWKEKRMLRVFDDNGKITGVQFDPEKVNNFKFDLRVTPGTTFGVSKEAILETTGNLFDKGVLDPETFVILNDLPFKNTIISKIRERDELQANAEALAQENELLKQQLTQLTGGQPAPAPTEGQPQPAPQLVQG